MAKTHWKKLTNPDYLGAYAFQPGEEKKATISTVKREPVPGADGRSEELPVVYWADKELKPLVLNSTNAKMLTKLLKSPYIEDWGGKTIILSVEMVNAFGERVEAVRIKKQLPVQSAIACTDCGQIIQDADGYTVHQIINASSRKYGCDLCMDCAKERASTISTEDKTGGTDE